MFTKTRTWQRWSGPRAELTAAINLASTVLQQWSGIPATVEVRISYANQLTETSVDPTALEQVHTTDLRRIKDVWIDIGVDMDWWQEQMRVYHSQEINLRLGGNLLEAAALVKPPALMHAGVLLRLSGGLSASMVSLVRGPDRTNVEGLAARLAEVLDRSTSGPTRVPAQIGLLLLLPTAMLGWIIGSKLVRTFDLAPINNHYEWQEILIPMVAMIICAGALGIFVWALPGLEILAPGERSRFARYRAVLLTALGTVITGLIASALWASLT